jgi:hypothetical protein
MLGAQISYRIYVLFSTISTLLKSSVQNMASTSQLNGASSSSAGSLMATGDWTKDLVHLAKTSELKCV